MNEQPNLEQHDVDATPTTPSATPYTAPELADFGPIEVLTQGPGAGAEDGITGSLAG